MCVTEWMRRFFGWDVVNVVKLVATGFLVFSFALSPVYAALWSSKQWPPNQNVASPVSSVSPSNISSRVSSNAPSLTVTAPKATSSARQQARQLLNKRTSHPTQLLVKFKPDRLTTANVQQSEKAFGKKTIDKKVRFSNFSFAPRFKTRGVKSITSLLHQQPEKNTNNRKITRSSKRTSQSARSRLERWTVVTLNEGEDLERVLAEFINDPDVENVFPNYTVSVNLIPNDPLLNELWGLNNTGQVVPAEGIPRSDTDQVGLPDADIDAPEAWDVVVADPTVVIAVIDTGVDYNHPDLAANMWVNPGEIADNGIDDDNNGFIDDIHGADFRNNDADPMDDHGHGTHVAGTISAVSDNGIGVVGVSAGVKIMALKFLGANGSGFIADAARALTYAQEKNVRISNNSWGGSGYAQVFFDTLGVLNADGSDHLFVAAAGNSALNTDASDSRIGTVGSVRYPQGYERPNVVSVGATTFDDELAFFSNFGISSVDVMAPGFAIYSTVPAVGCPLCQASGYRWLSGTSMAAPHVAGVAGLLLSQNAALTATQLKARLMASVDQIEDFQSRSVTGGRLNAYNAVTCDNLTPTIRSNLPDGFTVYKGEDSVPVRVSLFNCDDLLTNATLTASFSNGDADVTFFDDGQHNDEQADDGIYGAEWVPAVLGSVTVTISVTHGAAGAESLLINGTVKNRFYRFEEISYDWIDATQSGTRYSLTTGESVDVPIGFDFLFYGQVRNSLSIWPNGTITFGDDVPDRTSPQLYPNAETPNEMISPLWVRRYSGNPYEVHVLTDGVAPNRRMTIQWTVNAHIFEASLYEGSGDIIFQYNDIIPNKHLYRNFATVGVEDFQGFDGTTYLFNSSSLGLLRDHSDNILNPVSSEMALRFYPVGFPSDSLPPVAVMSVPASGYTLAPLAFSGTGSFAPEGQPLRYIWDFGDGANATGLEVTHAYAKPGTYTVTLWVYDGLRYSTAVTRSIDILQGEVDMLIRSVSGPAAGETGERITIETVIENQGTGGGYSGSVFHFLSSDDVLGNDIYIGQKNSSGELIEPQDSRIVSVTFTLSTAVTAGTYRLVSVIGAFPGNTNNSSWNNYRYMGDSITVSVGPDFEITSLTHPTKAMPGDQVTVATSIRNNGTTTASTNYRVYLSTDPVVTAQDTLLFSTSSWATGPGVSITYPRSFVLDAGLALGNYYIGAIVDWDDRVVESDESNNVYASPVPIAVGEVNQAPVAVISGAATGIVNGGTVLFDASGSIDPDGDPLFYAWQFGDGRTGKGEKPEHGYSAPGTFTVTLTVNDGVQDSAPVTMDVVIDYGADITMSAPILTTTQAYLGDTLPINFNILNIGSTEVIVNRQLGVSVRGYLDTDNDPTNGYHREFFVGQFGAYVAPKPGESLAMKANVPLTTSYLASEGDWYVWFKVTPLNECSTCQDNNIVVVPDPITVRLDVDLHMTHISASSTVLTPGEYFELASTVKNSGRSEVNDKNHRVQLYISEDATITTQDRLLSSGNYWRPGILAANASASFTRNVGIPSNLLPGTYYLGAIADAKNVQVETNESNNASVAMQVQLVVPDVDLVISDILVNQESTPIIATFNVANNVANNAVNSVAQGGSLTLSTLTVNAGQTTSTSTRTRLVLSSDQTADASDTIVDEWSVAGLSGGGSTNNHTSFLTLDPALPAGIYYLIAIADQGARQQESNETNNIGVVPLSIVTVNPDLVVSNLTASVAQIAPGDSFILSNTVLNQGTTTTLDAFNVGLYLSADTQITTSDRLVKFRSINGLLKGESSSVDSRIYIDANQTPGCYTLGAIVDYSQRVDESCPGCEANNILSGPQIEIGGAACGAVNRAPVAFISGPTSGGVAQPLVFDASGSSDPNGDTLTYRWDFGDGTTATGVSPSHAYLVAGIYTVTLVVNDGELDSVPVTAAINIAQNTVPVAVIGGPQAGNAGVPVVFNGSASNDADGDSLTYRWSFGDGTTDTTSGAMPSHTYTAAGTYSVTLVVNDGIDDSIPVVATITIADANAAPYADLAMTSVSGPGSASTGGSMAVSGTVVNQGTGSTSGYYLQVYFYLSADAVYDSNDTFIGNQLPGTLSAGQSKTLSRTLSVPSNLAAGDYFLLAVVDPNNNVPEQDDPDNLNGNNLAVATTTVTVE
ncbi:MAG: S8 family serine peptidase [Gammaproteobacteria bacterium]|nr:S8 family serine peptidase [Gammaproteobacteria bacterium]